MRIGVCTISLSNLQDKKFHAQELLKIHQEPAGQFVIYNLGLRRATTDEINHIT